MWWKVVFLALAFAWAAAEPGDPVAQLQRKIDGGETKLVFDASTGYLKSLLEKLNVAISSQVLVFSKSNFQLDLVSPSRPRALYFNDDVYIGWVRGGTDVELAAIDPKLGPVFYTLAQANTPKPKFVRQSSNCIVCHDSSQTTDPIPRLLMLSILPDVRGNALKATAVVTNDKSPFRERWGGWYVTGTHGKQRHLGNTIVRLPASAVTTVSEYAAKANLEEGANITDLTGRLDDTRYLSHHSDIVALMILGHQTHVLNLMTLATYEKSDDGEKIARALLFADEAPLTDPINGTSSFASDFSSRGPRDSKGRSLRDLDLNRRLLRYPLSYVIYSRTFDEMPPSLLADVKRRIRAILTGQDKSPDFAHISAADRGVILEILAETKPGF
ncbi:MAG: hypothetical protein HY646_04610 [Acidobacteria bacterium]|nr:hypothetical protein [Acidobacteriota bacterium]